MSLRALVHPLWYTAGKGDKFGRKVVCFCRGYGSLEGNFIYFKWMKSFSHMYSCLYP